MLFFFCFVLRFEAENVISKMIGAELIIRSCSCGLLDLGAIHTCEWPLKNPTNILIYGFQGVFNANVFSELGAHTESKMIIFTSGPLQGFMPFFQSCIKLVRRRR